LDHLHHVAGIEGGEHLRRFAPIAVPLVTSR
jgi:hypothetical protein